MMGLNRSLLALFFMLNSVAASRFPLEPVATSKNRKGIVLSKLVENSIPTDNSGLQRSLEAEIDLTGYEIKFEKCQSTKLYSDELAEAEDSETVLALKKFIIYRLCPANSCGSCNKKYGEYVTDMETYLEAASAFLVEDREGYCGLCQEVCEADDDNTKSSGVVDCDQCYNYCLSVAAMEDNGYVESYQYSACNELAAGDDGGNAGVFVAAVCSDNGSAIKIGAFSDDQCNIRQSGVDIESYLGGLMLNDEILGKATDKSSCISCVRSEYAMPEDDDAGDDWNAGDDVVEMNEMCAQLYEASGKCESKHGFSPENYYWKSNEQLQGEYMQEELVCNFINSLKTGSYDEYGEVGSSMKRGGGGQKFALTFFILGTVAFTGYAAMLHSKLTKGGKESLSSQGGAMA